MNYEFRALKSTDLGTVCKIITKIGARQFKDCFQNVDIKSKNLDAIGVSIMLDIAGIVIAGIPSAERDIQEFLASLTGMKLAEVQEMPLADYMDLIIAVVTKDEFKDFFVRALKLFNQ